VTGYDLLDVEEISVMLDVTPQYVRTARLRVRQGSGGRWTSFPEPLRQVSGRPVWLRRDVERWVRSNG